MLSTQSTISWRTFRNSREHDDRPHHVANRILRSYGVKSPPVPIEAIAKWLQVRVEKRPNPGWDGSVDTTQNPPVVSINAATAGTRQRFTLAHELGHALLHPSGKLFRDTTFSSSGDRLEREANEFAAAILIPMWLLEPIVINKRLKTSELANMFDVSPGAMSIQLEKLL
jgi:Zn-dependent peptidase ImmA (M78 family)